MPLGGPDHALDVIAAAMGGPRLAFDPGGVCQLTVQDAFVLNLVRGEGGVLRLVTFLDGQIQPMTARFLLNALAENHRGGTGPHARFGLHAGAGVLVLEEAVDCAASEAGHLEARVLGFVKLAAYWVLNADNLFEDPSPLEGQVHRTGAAMGEDELQSYALLGADLSSLVRV